MHFFTGGRVIMDYGQFEVKNISMLNFSKSVPMKKQTHLHLGCPEGDCIFS